MISGKVEAKRDCILSEKRVFAWLRVKMGMVFDHMALLISYFFSISIVAHSLTSFWSMSLCFKPFIQLFKHSSKWIILLLSFPF